MRVVAVATLLAAIASALAWLFLIEPKSAEIERGWVRLRAVNVHLAELRRTMDERDSLRAEVAQRTDRARAAVPPEPLLRELEGAFGSLAQLRGFSAKVEPRPSTASSFYETLPMRLTFEGPRGEALALFDSLVALPRVVRFDRPAVTSLENGRIQLVLDAVTFRTLLAR